MSTYAAPEMRQVTVPQVILILGLALIVMAGTVIMALAGLDVVAILSGLVTVGLVVATLFGINLKHTVDQVKDISNGRLTEVLDANKSLTQVNHELHEKIASLSMLVPPPEIKS